MPTGRSRCIQQIDFFSGCHGGVIRWWTGPSPSVSGRRLLKLFTAVPDALLWAIGRRGVVHAMHYLDNFLLLGPPNSAECGQAIQGSLQLCDRLGFPIAPHKLEGPASRLSFLGILIDTDRDTLSLPADKLARLRSVIVEWRERKFCSKRQLLSLIGQLQHACRVVRAGRTFLRRMIDTVDHCQRAGSLGTA